ncbi:hypothetical protein NHQ30_001153 [Ciborinia camelliae]|nr:hypothetical protein NHQ30_001153 [Ciborinia camelliae]
MPFKPASIEEILAWLLVEQLGIPGKYGDDSDVLTYISTNDVRFSALVLAAGKAGYTVAHHALFDQLKCHTLITSDPIPSPARVILDAVKPRRHFTVLSVEELLTKQYPHYVLSKSFQNLRQSLMVVMHTSGTTGLPKPLIWTHETCTQVLDVNACETPKNIPSVNGSFLKGKRGALLAQQESCNADVLSNDDDDPNGETILNLTPTILDGTNRLVRKHVHIVTECSRVHYEKAFHRPDFAFSTIYQNPTVAPLAAAILTSNEDGAVYKMLREEIGLIIHASWPVNFNPALPAFHAQLAGLVNLLTLATPSTSRTVRFIFVSSIAAVEEYTRGSAPEEGIRNLDTPAPLGYARAKFLAELLVDAAARHLGNAVLTTIIRIVQIADPALYRGLPLVEPREQLPSIILSSLHLCQKPDSLGPHFNNVDFVPVDLLGDILVDLATTTTKNGSEMQIACAMTVFDLRNLHGVPWSTLLPAIIAMKPPQIVSPATWLERLRVSGEGEDNDVMLRKINK